MMSAYLEGSQCEDCFGYGKRNYLKPFYINLDEQIVKCESSTCMFPYIKRSECITFTDLKPTECSNSIDLKPPEGSTYTDLKPSECMISLDEFIKESAKQIDSKPVKYESKINIRSIERIPIMFDFSSIFMDNTVQAKAEEKPVTCASILAGNSSTHDDTKKTNCSKNESLVQAPPKTRISRCLANLKSSSTSKKFNSKREKGKRGENNVLVIDPQSGKRMRPLDLIKHYIGTKI